MNLEKMREHWQLTAIRQLPDESIAGVQRLTTTWSLMLGIEAETWRYRFCYRRLDDALGALATVNGETDIPDGWIACRPEVRVGRGPDERYPTPDELRQLRARKP